MEFGGDNFQACGFIFLRGLRDTREEFKVCGFRVWIEVGTYR